MRDRSTLSTTTRRATIGASHPPAIPSRIFMRNATDSNTSASALPSALWWRRGCAEHEHASVGEVAQDRLVCRRRRVLRLVDHDEAERISWELHQPGPAQRLWCGDDDRLVAGSLACLLARSRPTGRASRSSLWPGRRAPRVLVPAADGRNLRQGRSPSG